MLSLTADLCNSTVSISGRDCKPHIKPILIHPLAVRAAAKQLQTDLEFYRQSLHKLFHGLLVNASSRDSTLRYLAEVK